MLYSRAVLYFMGTDTTPTAVRRTRLPLWARLADGVALALSGMALLVAVFGGFRTRTAGMRVAVTSAPRILAIIAVIVVARHLIRRDAPIYQRLWNGLQRAWASDIMRYVVPVWGVSRLAVLVVGFLALGTFGFRGERPPFSVYENEILDLPARWDVGWYLGIARDGYSWNPAGAGHQNIAFMPALPMLLRLGGRLNGGHPLWAGQLLVLAASLWAFAYVYRLARSALGEDEHAAWAVGLLAAYPFAVFYSAVYTESLFLLCSAGAFYHLGRREFIRAASFALLCGFTRPNGFLLAAPLALVSIWPATLAAWRDKRGRTSARIAGVVRQSLPALAVASAAAVGLIVFSVFIYTLTGRPFAWLEAHAAWGRTFGTWLTRGPFQVMHDDGLYVYLRSQPVDAVNFLAAIGGLLAIWPVTRRLGVPYGAFLAINLIPPLAAGGLLSIGRVTAAMFPAFIWLAAVIPARHRAAWLTAFALLQGWGASLFYTWREFI